ncbi:MAG: hypothetical protein ACRDOD_25665 [Streptosporangiaceae bacterium]
MTPGQLAGEILEVDVLRRLTESGDDTEGERVAADTGEVLSEQVNCPPEISGGKPEARVGADRAAQSRSGPA